VKVRLARCREITGYVDYASTFRPGDVTVLFSRSVDSVPVASLELYLECTGRWVSLAGALRSLECGEDRHA
jgi:hypothetical protein